MIHWGPYEAMCKGVIPDAAVTRTDEKGDVWVLYIPTDKGAEFHAAEEPYVLGEGGRGSAKSTTLRWDAHLRNLSIPGHRALLLRRTFPQLRGSHFAKVAVEGKLLGLDKDAWNQSKFYLTYKNGSVLQFGHCESDAAILDYLSQEWDWIGFDELTTFTFDQFIRICASARIAISESASGRRAFVRGATNPIGIGASWVKRYFKDKNVAEQDNPDYNPDEWKAIKMNLIDNPHLDKGAYERKLLMLPNESLRRAYIDGEWLVEGQFFSRFAESKNEKPWHVIPEMPTLQGVPFHLVPWMQVIRCLDWGYSEIEPGYCGWIVMAPDGTAIVFKEWVFTGQTPEEAAEKIKEMSQGMKIRFTIADPMMFAEREGPSIARRMSRKGITPIPANNDRENGWMSVHSWLQTIYDDGNGPRPRLQFLAPQGDATGLGVGYAIRTLPSLQTDPKKPKDTMQGPGIEDHAADAIRYWANDWDAPSVEPPKNLDWVAPEIRRAMGEAFMGDDPVLGSESVR